ncbi:MAG: hypothetical protein JW866_03850 [Ignavibacteriales bacterium]|nr:hypothetical protein [Ignavibacteriales bacterium]
MFKEEIKNLYNENISKLKSIDEECTFYDLLKTTLHPAILQYISAELDYVVFEDRLKFSDSTLISYKENTFNESFAIVADEVKKNKRFKKEYFHKLILYAISFNVNFLIQQVNTIKIFLFDDKEKKNKTEIEKTLNYFFYYDYLRKAIWLFLEKTKEEISFKEFSNFIENVEEKLRTKYIRKVIKAFLNSITDFWNKDKSENVILSTNIIDSFLQSMKLEWARQKFREEFLEHSGKLCDVKDVKIFFDSLLPGLFYSSSNIVKESVKHTEKKIFSDESVYEQKRELKRKDDEQIEIEKDNEELEVVYDLDDNDDEIIEKSRINKTDIRDDQLYEFGDSDYVNAINDSIQEILSKKKINKVIEEVFDDDSELFIQTVERMLTHNNQKEALLIIDKLFKLKDLKPSSRLAKVFKKIISEYIDRVQGYDVR